MHIILLTQYRVWYSIFFLLLKSRNLIENERLKKIIEQHGGFLRAHTIKIGKMVRDQVRILYIYYFYGQNALWPKP